MQTTFRMLAIASLLATISPSHASDYAFRLHNKADGYNIKGFYTYVGDGKWSNNWLKDGMRVHPGESVGMDWNSNEGNCEVAIRVDWDDWGAEDFKVDWCKGVHNIYMKDKDASWD